MITTNTFMKREFGKNLIEDFFPTIDLTHVLDTSRMGHTLAGHGTPTVILFGRNRKPTGDTVRAVLGIKGEPSATEDHAKGLVWQSILKNIDVVNVQDEYTSAADVPRPTFAKHPWSIGGGGAADLKEQIESVCETTLINMIVEVGFGAVTREDDVYLVSTEVALRHSIPKGQIRPLVSGDEIRDWVILNPVGAVFPYDPVTLASTQIPQVEKFLWPWKRQLSDRVAYGLSQLERGLHWFEFSMWFSNRFRTPLCITFAFVATHNHLVLDRGGRVQSLHSLKNFEKMGNLHQKTSTLGRNTGKNRRAFTLFGTRFPHSCRGGQRLLCAIFGIGHRNMPVFRSPAWRLNTEKRRIFLADCKRFTRKGCKSSWFSAKSRFFPRYFQGMERRHPIHPAFAVVSETCRERYSITSFCILSTSAL